MPSPAVGASLDARPSRSWRLRPLPAVTMPAAREDRKKTGLLSLALHILVFALILEPVFDHDTNVVEGDLRAAGAGPIGGGGGGRRGTGGVRERVHYVTATPAATPQPVLQPPEIVPPRPQLLVPPIQQPPPEISLPRMDVKIAAPPVAVPMTSVVAGVGGGTGRDGSIGDGRGRGGGVGFGVGTGRGSGTGPGTGGGGSLEYYPPSPIALIPPPLPIPVKVRGHYLVVEFDIDSTGRVIGKANFNPTRDGDYNKSLEALFKNFRFRPATTLDGKPMRARFQIIYDFHPMKERSPSTGTRSLQRFRSGR